MTDDKELRALALAATPGPWCYESCGEKGDGANIIGVAFGPDDEECERPLSGRLREWDDAGKEIDYYRAEEVAVCEHRNRNPGADAAFIAAANPQTILSLLDRLQAAERIPREREAKLAREMRERDEQWLELIAVCDKAMDGLHLPLEGGYCTDAELARWSDAITTILKNHRVARFVIESRNRPARLGDA